MMQNSGSHEQLLTPLCRDPVRLMLNARKVQFAGFLSMCRWKIEQFLALNNSLPLDFEFCGRLAFDS